MSEGAESTLTGTLISEIRETMPTIAVDYKGVWPVDQWHELRQLSIAAKANIWAAVLVPTALLVVSEVRRSRNRRSVHSRGEQDCLAREKQGEGHCREGKPVKVEVDLGDGLGDWRIHAVTTTTSDLPDRGPGRRAKAAGARAAVIRRMLPRKGEQFSFIDFSSTALALSIAIAADRRAAELRTHVTPDAFETETGIQWTIRDDKLPGFYDFIEQSMIAILFSYQALEAFSNLTIQDKLGETGTFTVTRTIAKVKQKLAWQASDLERKCSTEEKIGEIVPMLLGVASPKGKRVGQDFDKLKKVRDDVTHLKYHDQRGAAKATLGGDSESVFFRMVNGDYEGIPRTAVVVLDYFTKPIGTPRWLRYPLSVYGLPATDVATTANRITIADEP